MENIYFHSDLGDPEAGAVRFCVCVCGGGGSSQVRLWDYKRSDNRGFGNYPG